MTENPIDGALVLVIEDDPDTNQTICDWLTLFRMRPVGLLRFDPASVLLRDEPDAVLVDLMLPDRDGIEVAQALRASGYTGPIVAMSASDRMLHLAEDERGMFVTTVAKPLDFYLVHQVVVDAIRASRGTA